MQKVSFIMRKHNEAFCIGISLLVSLSTLTVAFFSYIYVSRSRENNLCAMTYMSPAFEPIPLFDARTPWCENDIDVVFGNNAACKMSYFADSASLWRYIDVHSRYEDSTVGISRAEAASDALQEVRLRKTKPIQYAKHWLLYYFQQSSVFRPLLRAFESLFRTHLQSEYLPPQRLALEAANQRYLPQRRAPMHLYRDETTLTLPLEIRDSMATKQWKAASLSQARFGMDLSTGQRSPTAAENLANPFVSEAQGHSSHAKLEKESVLRVPILFVPGHGGDYRQSRSLAETMLEMQSSAWTDALALFCAYEAKKEAENSKHINEEDRFTSASSEAKKAVNLCENALYLSEMLDDPIRFFQKVLSLRRPPNVATPITHPAPSTTQDTASMEGLNSDAMHSGFPQSDPSSSTPSTAHSTWETGLFNLYRDLATASSASRTPRVLFDTYALDFNEVPTALFGGWAINDQALIIQDAIKSIAMQYESIIVPLEKQNEGTLLSNQERGSSENTQTCTEARWLQKYIENRYLDCETMLQDEQGKLFSLSRNMSVRAMKSELGTIDATAGNEICKVSVDSPDDLNPASPPLQGILVSICTPRAVIIAHSMGGVATGIVPFLERSKQRDLNRRRDQSDHEQGDILLDVDAELLHTMDTKSATPIGSISSLVTIGSPLLSPPVDIDFTIRTVYSTLHYGWKRILRNYGSDFAMTSTETIIMNGTDTTWYTGSPSDNTLLNNVPLLSFSGGQRDMRVLDGSSDITYLATSTMGMGLSSTIVGYRDMTKQKSQRYSSSPRSGPSTAESHNNAASGDSLFSAYFSSFDVRFPLLQAPFAWFSTPSIPCMSLPAGHEAILSCRQVIRPMVHVLALTYNMCFAFETNIPQFGIDGQSAGASGHVGTSSTQDAAAADTSQSTTRSLFEIMQLVEQSGCTEALFTQLYSTLLYLQPSFSADQQASIDLASRGIQSTIKSSSKGRKTKHREASFRPNPLDIASSPQSHRIAIPVTRLSVEARKKFTKSNTRSSGRYQTSEIARLPSTIPVENIPFFDMLHNKVDVFAKEYETMDYYRHPTGITSAGAKIDSQEKDHSQGEEESVSTIAFGRRLDMDTLLSQRGYSSADSLSDDGSLTRVSASIMRYVDAYTEGFLSLLNPYALPEVYDDAVLYNAPSLLSFLRQKKPADDPEAFHTMNHARTDDMETRHFTGRNLAETGSAIPGPIPIKPLSSPSIVTADKIPPPYIVRYPGHVHPSLLSKASRVTFSQHLTSHMLAYTTMFIQYAKYMFCLLFWMLSLKILAAQFRGTLTRAENRTISAEKARIPAQTIMISTPQTKVHFLHSVESPEASKSLPKSPFPTLLSYINSPLLLISYLLYPPMLLISVLVYFLLRKSYRSVVSIKLPSFLPHIIATLTISIKRFTIFLVTYKRTLSLSFLLFFLFPCILEPVLKLHTDESQGVTWKGTSAYFPSSLAPVQLFLRPPFRKAYTFSALPFEVIYSLGKRIPSIPMLLIIHSFLVLFLFFFSYILYPLLYSPILVLRKWIWPVTRIISKALFSFVSHPRDTILRMTRRQDKLEDPREAADTPLLNMQDTLNKPLGRPQSISDLVPLTSKSSAAGSSSHSWTRIRPSDEISIDMSSSKESFQPSINNSYATDTCIPPVHESQTTIQPDLSCTSSSPSCDLDVVAVQDDNEKGLKCLSKGPIDQATFPITFFCVAAIFPLVAICYSFLLFIHLTLAHADTLPRFSRDAVSDSSTAVLTSQYSYNSWFSLFVSEVRDIFTAWYSYIFHNSPLPFLALLVFYAGALTNGCVVLYAVSRALFGTKVPLVEEGAVDGETLVHVCDGSEKDRLCMKTSPRQRNEKSSANILQSIGENLVFLDMLLNPERSTIPDEVKRNKWNNFFPDFYSTDENQFARAELTKTARMDIVPYENLNKTSARRTKSCPPVVPPMISKNSTASRELAEGLGLPSYNDWPKPPIRKNAFERSLSLPSIDEESYCAKSHLAPLAPMRMEKRRIASPLHAKAETASFLTRYASSTYTHTLRLLYICGCYLIALHLPHVIGPLFHLWYILLRNHAQDYDYPSPTAGNVRSLSGGKISSGPLSNLSSSIHNPEPTQYWNRVPGAVFINRLLKSAHSSEAQEQRPSPIAEPYLYQPFPSSETSNATNFIPLSLYLFVSLLPSCYFLLAVYCSRKTRQHQII